MSSAYRHISTYMHVCAYECMHVCMHLFGDFDESQKYISQMGNKYAWKQERFGKYSKSPTKFQIDTMYLYIYLDKLSIDLYMNRNFICFFPAHTSTWNACLQRLYIYISLLQTLHVTSQASCQYVRSKPPTILSASPLRIGTLHWKIMASWDIVWIFFGGYSCDIASSFC